MLRSVVSALAETEESVSIAPAGAAAAIWADLNHDRVVKLADAVPALERSNEQPNILITGTSLHSDYERSLWRIARPNGVRTLAIVDGWTNLRGRFEDSENCLVQPDAVGVIDEWCKARMEASAWCKARIHVVGHPNLELISRRRALRNRVQPSHDRRAFAFLSEPIREDWPDKASPGFDQFTVAGAFFSAISSESNVSVVIKPHPREEVANWHIWLREAPAAMACSVNVRTEPVEILWNEVNGAVGMSSNALIEACLVGLPVLSLQPGRNRDVNPGFQLFPQIETVTRPSAVTPAIRQFIKKEHQPGAASPPHPIAEGALDRTLRCIRLEMEVGNA